MNLKKGLAVTIILLFIGISVIPSTASNTVEKNSIIHNDIGIEVSESRRKLITQNNFIGNIVHATFEMIGSVFNCSWL